MTFPQQLLERAAAARCVVVLTVPGFRPKAAFPRFVTSRRLSEIANSMFRGQITEHENHSRHFPERW
jgi:hypothetical protein